jgi:hypothetical protein
MNLKGIFFCFIAFGMTSCMWGVPKKEKHAISKDTLLYTYKVFRQQAADCGDKADSNCTVIKFNYPLFKNQKALNDSVINKLLSLFGENNKTDTSLQQLAKTFLTNYQNFKQDRKYPVTYTVDGYAKVIRQDSSLTVLQAGGYSFQGGAHGASFTYFINWNTKANKAISLNDLFKVGYADKLKSIGEADFRKNEKLSDTTSLANGYFFKNNKFELNNNFSVTPLGIRFLYNQYEIKPYAAGTTDLFIPYSQIKSLLRPNTVVEQYIK